MLLRYGLAAVLAALTTLMGNVVWAQNAIYFKPELVQTASPCETKGNCCAAKGCCAAGTCCKDGKCCKDGECCCKGKKCDANCTCCKDNKCECGKGGECCCKDGKCCCKDKCGCCFSVVGQNFMVIGRGKCCCKDKSGCCCKDKASVKQAGCGCCPFLSKVAKGTAVIMVMPSSLPLLGACHPEMMGMLPHPPLPVAPHVMMPIPLPPPPTMQIPAGLPAPSMTAPVMPPHTVAIPVPPQTVAIPVPPPSCCPCPTPVPTICATTSGDAVTVSKANIPVETCLQMLGVASDLCSLVRPMNTPSTCLAALELLMAMCPAIGYDQPAPSYVMHPPQYIPPSPTFPLPRELAAQEAAAAGSFAAGSYAAGSSDCGSTCCPVPHPTTCAAPCVVAKPATDITVHAIAPGYGATYSDQLEMNIGDHTLSSKKMKVKIGENEIRLSRIDDRIRVRGDELKATADSVRSNQKDNLILEGDVVLHYKKDGHSINVTGDRVELNLSSGAVTIKPAVKAPVRPAVRIDRVDTDEK
jgi:hypothetical protein